MQRGDSNCWKLICELEYWSNNKKKMNHAEWKKNVSRKVFIIIDVNVDVAQQNRDRFMVQIRDCPELLFRDKEKKEVLKCEST